MSTYCSEDEAARGDWARERAKDERSIGPSLKVFRPQIRFWIDCRDETVKHGPVFSTWVGADAWVRERIRNGANRAWMSINSLILNKRSIREINYFHPGVDTGFDKDGGAK